MASKNDGPEEELHLLRASSPTGSVHRSSVSSLPSSSDTSLVLERLNEDGIEPRNGEIKPVPFEVDLDNYVDASYRSFAWSKSAKRSKWFIGLLGAACLGGWLLALVLFITGKSYRHNAAKPFDPAATAKNYRGKPITIDSVLTGSWNAERHHISWIRGPDGEDGYLLERNTGLKDDYLYVEDIRARKPHTEAHSRISLMKSGLFNFNDNMKYVEDAWPSSDLKKVLILTDKKKNWRHSYTGLYWLFDVESQQAEPLDPAEPEGRVQLASWSPNSDMVVFTRNNNLYLREVASKSVQQITNDGGPEIFYGVPDWVYEEEIFSGNSVTWWSESGDFIAFLRTNDSMVPQYPIEYFLSRPSGTKATPGEENYPEVRQLKYPKAGAPNPIVHVHYYDVAKKEAFQVSVGGDFADHDRLVTELVWAGKSGKAIIKNTNRESDFLKVALVDVTQHTGSIVRAQDIKKVDGGWFEVSEKTTFVPADPTNGRPDDGYLDTVIHEGYDHLAYFTPLDNPEPRPLTSGAWEVVDAPSAVDLSSNVVYLVTTKESSMQRHIYSVNLDGTGLQHISDADHEGYYEVSFSTGAGFALLSYLGPDVPWQEIRSTPSYKGHLWQYQIEDNKRLAKLASETDLPTEIYSTILVEDVELNVVERRPAHFDKNKKYPVLFQLYGGPGSQMVNKKFAVDFQSYVASSLEYIVVTLDGRGTGFLGRKARTVIRGHIGLIEAADQIHAAKIWAAKDYVDPERIAIWGWSYGGFMALKTLEIDGGQTFKYGMAVAPVTDWSFYDSVYTERYMETPQNNAEGYENTSITDVESLQQNVRFLILHGVADDNVHLQNTLTLLDKLDLAGVENYDVHIFPDSDHNIVFHNANRMVYDRLNNWIINAFNGEWLRSGNAAPIDRIGADISVR